MSGERVLLVRPAGNPGLIDVSVLVDKADELDLAEVDRDLSTPACALRLEVKGAQRDGVAAGRAESAGEGGLPVGRVDDDKEPGGFDLVAEHLSNGRAPRVVEPGGLEVLAA